MYHFVQKACEIALRYAEKGKKLEHTENKAGGLGCMWTRAIHMNA